MKYLVIAVTLLVMAGCSNTPSKLQRIEALEGASSSQQSQINQNKAAIETNKQTITNVNTKIDRMFEKAMYK